MLHIKKASNEGLCFCACEDALMAVPGQLDCPWCGCGWLLTCSTCGKAFTFGRAVEVEGDLEEMVRADLSKHGWDKRAVKEMLAPSVEFMQYLMEDLEEGSEYIYLDGALIPTDAEGPFEFEGMYARHDLAELPHLAARDNPDALNHVLGDVEYWTSRQIEDEDGDEEEE